MYITAILIIFTLLGLYLDYRSEHQVKEESKKRKYGKFILIITFLGFVISSVSQYRDGINLSKKLQESENDLKSVKEALAEVKAQNDSLLQSNEILTIILKQNSVSLEELGKQTSEGFSQNQEYFESIETSSISRRRILTILQRSQLVIELSEKKGAKIAIEFPASDTESLQFAEQFKDVFVLAGWEVAGMTYVANPSATMKELNLVIRDANTPPDHALFLFTILKNIGLDCQIVIDQRVEENEVKLFIGKE